MNDDDYPARLEVDYPEQLDRVTTLFRPILVIPIAIVFAFLVSPDGESGAMAGSFGGLFAATVLMIVFRQRYPRWWFDFLREVVRFAGRIACYALLLTDRYPSTVDEQAYHLEIDYPDAVNDLNRWMPLVKWFLAIPHFLVLVVLMVGVIVVFVIAWFAILFTGRFPRPLFDYVVGVLRWWVRVSAYAVWLVTDRYPPIRLD
ncbi:MAG: DUF4389 domain-containing protein [Rhodobacteraceae bacterium]|nr:DUF4389 domain-containing protein [Paracoccaceae bacterium]MCY4137256.1 DUF4389 domain-containing protein [Paracoccaceae bacterium]